MAEKMSKWVIVPNEIYYEPKEGGHGYPEGYLFAEYGIAPTDEQGNPKGYDITTFSKDRACMIVELPNMYNLLVKLSGANYGELREMQNEAREILRRIDTLELLKNYDLIKELCKEEIKDVSESKSKIYDEVVDFIRRNFEALTKLSEQGFSWEKIAEKYVNVERKRSIPDVAEAFAYIFPIVQLEREYEIRLQNE